MINVLTGSFMEWEYLEEQFPFSFLTFFINFQFFQQPGQIIL